MSLLIAFLISMSLSPEPAYVERAFYVMGTVIEFKLYCESKEVCNKAATDAHSEIARLDKMLSSYKEESDLTRVNSLAGKGRVPVPEEFVELTERSIHFSNLTDGAFDITVGKLIGLWRQAEEKNALPSEQAVEKAVSECVGFDKINLFPQKLELALKSECVSINFGGIGKGYAIDRAVSILINEGVKSGLINFGGNIYALGSPPGKEGWRAGVRNPRKEGEILTFIEVKNMAVSTSGDYERFLEIEGKRFSHILNPKTGYPVDTAPSVTVLARSATDADALSTGISVMGKKKAVEMMKKVDNAGFMVVTLKGETLSIFRDHFFKRFEVTDSD